MRVVDRKSFLALPEGTIYCKGQPWFFDGLCIKGESLSNDWFYVNPAWPESKDSGEGFATLEWSKTTGESFAMETTEGRDGCFDDDDLFLIFERADLALLRQAIDRAHSVAIR